MKKESINIKIAGDLALKNPASGSLVSDCIKNYLSASDLNIFNLECPITSASEEHKIIKSGPYLKGSSALFSEIVKLLNIHVVSLANNHILDYGERGLNDTLVFCKSENLKYVGAGKDLEQASKTLYLEQKGHKLAIVNFSENEWSSASATSSGAHPMNIVSNIKKIRDAKSSSDKVIVIVHGGHEYYNLPSPRMVEQYRFYAENGADLVVGHHTHCISGNENYKGVPIYYSLGNFWFDKVSKYDDWYNGLILDINISEEGTLSSSLQPVMQTKETFHLSLPDHKSTEKLIQRVEKYSSIIRSSELLSEEWSKYVANRTKHYLEMWSPSNHIASSLMRKIFNKLGLNLLNKRGSALYLNLLRCEAHSDVSKEVLEIFLANKGDKTRIIKK